MFTAFGIYVHLLMRAIVAIAFVHTSKLLTFVPTFINRKKCPKR